MSAFEKWFEAQHGPRRLLPHASDEELNDRVEAGRLARTEAQRRLIWDAQRKSALYAWSIAEKDKAATSE